MTVTTTTAISVATLPVGGHLGTVASAYVERTAVDRWRFRADGHDVSLHREARTWRIDDRGIPVTTEPALFDAVNLAFAAL